MITGFLDVSLSSKVQILIIFVNLLMQEALKVYSSGAQPFLT